MQTKLQGVSSPVSAAEVATGHQHPVDLRREESPDQDLSVSKRLGRDAGSTRKMHAASATPSAPEQETGKPSSPGRLVQEVANDGVAYLIGGIATPSRQSWEFGIAASAQARVAKEEVAAAAEQWHPRSAGSPVAPRKLSDSSTEFERVVRLEAAGRTDGISPTREPSEAAGRTDGISPTQEPSGAKDKTHPTQNKLPVKPVLSKLGSSQEVPAAAVAHRADHENGHENGSYQEEYRHREGSEGGDEESENQGFEYGGEQEEQKDARRENPEKNRQNNVGEQEAAENAAQETNKDYADRKAEKGGVTSEGGTAHSVPGANSSSQHTAQDTLAESSTPAAGRAAQVLAKSPQSESVQHASAEAVSRPRYCPEAEEDGDKHERTQAPHSALIIAGPSTELTSNTRIVGSVTEQLSGAVTCKVATDKPNGQISIQAAPGYLRLPSYVPGQLMRPAPSAARANIQLSLPPIIGEEIRLEAICATSNANPIKTAQAAAGVEPEESGEPAATDESWAAYHARNIGRQHSTSNFVAVRRPLRQLSVELFEEDDSDDTIASRLSSATVEDNASNEERSDKDTESVTWQQSEEGKSRMAQLTKATVAVESPATKMSRKYLQLFAPSNSAHDTYKVLATLHRKMNGTGWPRRGGWDSYLVRRSRVELDGGRVYGIKSKDGRVELLVLSCNKVYGRIPPTIARLESLKCINLSDNHISGPIPVELGSLLQLQTLQLQGNNLRDSIPSLIGSLISLIRLSLGHNKLSGPLPDSLGNLIHLQYFSAEHNRLTGPVPSSVRHMTALETFNVSNNELSGAIPDNIGALTRLRKLDLANNRLSGDISTSLGALLSLNWLLLDHNQLTGPVPANFGDLKELLILNLSFNRLSGPLPSALALLMKLTSASLQGNLFVGPFQFPAKVKFWFSKLSGMRALDLGFNGIEEPFPDMRGMHQLQSLVLNNNRIYDQLFEGLAEACPNLFKLHLQNNRLSGEIPQNLGALTQLEVLDLSANRFDGSLPASLESLQLLNTFSASNNELSGDLPSFLGSLTLLTCLALDGNQFSGPMPRELGKLTLLKRLYLENNELVGSIPKELSTCTSLEVLYLHDNRLWGKIPDSLRALRGLRYLNLHRNKFTGVVPEWLGELSRLRGLVMGENRLRGHIPWQLGHLHKLQDLYLNDNNLDGNIPERMVVNCERLQRLYLGGNRLTGTVPRYLRHVKDLRELNIERNNLHGELPIPLFLKTSLGPNACGLKWKGNPRIIDSRHNFASIMSGIQRAGPETETSFSEPQDYSQQSHARKSSFRPISFKLSVPHHPTSFRSQLSMSHGYQMTPPGPHLDTERSRGDDEGTIDSEDKDSKGLGWEGGIGAMEEGRGDFGDGRGGVARPWANSEDVSYFLFKVVAGNALVLIDYIIAARLYVIGCVWGSVLVMVWRAMAGFEGVLATRRFGYGFCWLPVSALGLALTWQARICFHHSCESDLFQALQEVEWGWHAMIQLATQLAAALLWWDRGQVGHWYLLASVGLKAIVVGIVSMQRLDDKRMTRYRNRRSESPKVGSAPSVFRDCFLPWLRDSAWPRLILVGFHAAEVCERTIPLASLIAAFGKWAFFAPLALAPGMIARYVARRAWTSRSGGDGGGIASSLRSTLNLSLALDSAFGAGTREHVLATISTTLEAAVFEVVASNSPREYSEGLHQGLVSSMLVMLGFTWAVVVIELAILGGHERERGAPRLLSPPPPPRLSLLRHFAPSKPFSRPGSASSKTPTTIQVKPPTTSLVVMPRINDSVYISSSSSSSSGSSELDRIEDGRQKLGGRGGQRTALVVPMEG